MLSNQLLGILLPNWRWVIEMLGGWANKIAQQQLTNHKLPNSPTAKLLGIYYVGQSVAQLLGKKFTK